MKSLAGYLLHPKIPTNQEDLRIIDLGAGTGIWAEEIADQYPNATIDAVDISADQFPPESFRSKNTHFWTHNCFEPFPEQYLGKFDVVHARFWLCIVNDDVAKQLFENFVTLLKPGGYLQWVEPLPRTAHVVSRNGGAPAPACEKLVQTWMKPTPLSSYDWVHALPRLFQEFKVQVEVEDKFTNPDRYLPIAAQTFLLGLTEYLYKNPEVEKYQEQLAMEHAGGAFVDVACTFVVGRKLVG
ncbi:S-adenosyl-L-methionine-dependent methyltransferase [Delitschia confertaspora ATCC 74209]|uniref:S-adenosyl-L-methionine-dependent methyltransferase n=1 Tax=Delitschia confertaspora ATCC 74209 TaxID=1513339 RepID=A0A9P4JE74_9PLEO|nr:S-adenosyl-L-methionine-dependent methyltransferase [Delitschia confertaspora ATCC 74209]